MVRDVDDFFKIEKELDFTTYHSGFENTTKHNISAGHGTSPKNAEVWTLVEGRKRNLTEMIDHFREKK